LSATPASAGVTTYHNPDTGAVTIASAASITLDSNAISIDDPDGDGNQIPWTSPQLYLLASR
jgi:hypothetical protein